MNRSFRVVAFVAVLGFALSIAGPVSAYNWETHQKIVGTAVSIMQTPPNSGQVAAPPGASLQEWQTFVALAKAAPTKLAHLRCGLPRSTKNDDGPDTPYPVEDGATCDFFPDDNLANIDLFRIEDLRYKAKRNASGGCGLVKTTQNEEVLQSVLGWHGGAPDDRLDDSVFWYRPTAALGSGPLSWSKELASNGWKAGFGSFATPFKCAWDALFGDGCDYGSGYDLAQEYNPVDVVDSWIPGFGSHRSSDYIGIWHFIDVYASKGRYNDIRGLYYPGAGRTHPGVVDIGIMAASDFLGLTLNAFQSDGDDFYGDYDKVGRGDLAWHAHTVAHTEFSPVDNLARYGWDRFKAGAPFGRTDARYLGWPLHALADASCPHHVAGTTSWGHRPWEDWVQEEYNSIIVPNFFGGPAATQQRTRILQDAFFWWMAFRQGENMESLVTGVALKTRGIVEFPNGDWPFDDSLSLSYHLGFKESAKNGYSGKEADAARFVEHGIGATLGFLVVVSENVVNLGPPAAIKCPTGTHYQPKTRKCEPGPKISVEAGPLPACIAGQPCDAGAEAGGCAKACQLSSQCNPPLVLCISKCCTAVPK